METNSAGLNGAFWREYTSAEAITKYSRATAGTGISYLLNHDYKDVYLQAVSLLPCDVRKEGMRILEFGCGAGMNLVHLLGILARQGIPVASAVGTDFSPVLIEAAKNEAKSCLQRSELAKLEFCVARNETLVTDLLESTGKDRSSLENSFHLILGVNTIRYCHAAKREMDNARAIFDLLAPGGVCVIIDMNNRFPLFRSDLKNRLRWKRIEQCYVPSLEEYAAPFSKTGFEVLRQEHFCWIPHSAGEFERRLLLAISPVLNATAKSRAMRSLVVARKPAAAR